jgi:hypothetical protein
MLKNPKCSGCYSYWKPDDSDIKTSGDIYKLCKKCREYKKKNNKCNHEGCKTQPVYNNPNETKGIYCAQHKKEGMIDVKHIKCNHEGCKTQPVFNNPNETKGIYCKEHKKKGMIDVIHAKCNHKGCKTQPSYNNPNETKGIYCNQHKKEGMINVKNKNKCNHEGCKTQPVYNNPNETKGIYCAQHKKEGMINVKDKMCNHEGCKTQPVFNNPNETKRIYCNQHKKEGMIDVKNKRCSTPLCSQFSIIEDYCTRCFYANNPNDKRVKNIKIKENEMIKYINENFKDLNWINDKPLEGDGMCLKKRPDSILHLNNHSIIIECDENQHRFYYKNEKSCEEAREHQIQEALNRPVVFIRFNPDSYIDENNKKIPSCFNVNKKLGFNTIPKKMEEPWKNRLTVLKNTILQSINIPPTEPITKILLFYDKSSYY